MTQNGRKQSVNVKGDIDQQHSILNDGMALWQDILRSALKSPSNPKNVVIIGEMVESVD
jgi:hypothetical protein